MRNLLVASAAVATGEHCRRSNLISKRGNQDNGDKNPEQKALLILGVTFCDTNVNLFKIYVSVPSIILYIFNKFAAGVNVFTLLPNM